MNCLYSSNYEKKKEKEEKKSIKFVEENKSDAGYRTLYLCSGDYKR